MSAHHRLERQLLDSVVHRRPRPRWRPRGLSDALVLCSCVAALGVAVFAIVSLHRRVASPRPAAPSVGVHAQAPAVCRSQVRRGVLPAWARAGFSPPTKHVPHVLGTSGDIVAVLFGDPLLSPPSLNHSNKVLWVSRVAVHPGSDLRIVAQPMTGRRRVGSPAARTVSGGPGPSIVNLPAAGCWRLTLRWSGHVDHLDLQYGARHGSRSRGGAG